MLREGDKKSIPNCTTTIVAANKAMATSASSTRPAKKRRDCIAASMRRRSLAESNAGALNAGHAASGFCGGGNTTDAGGARRGESWRSADGRMAC